jgi:hypothetical protein
MMNADGALMPIDKVKPAHKLEDQLVRRLIEDAQALSAQLTKFKDLAMSDAQEFRSMIADEYGAKKGGAKGNMTLRSYDGTLSVQVQVTETIDFGAELQAAKELIDDCVEVWSEGSNNNLQVLINHAFQVNKEGNIDTARVLGLRRLDITDEKWLSAMNAISDAVRVTGSRTYIRFYETDQKGERSAISLDLASA